MFALFSLILPLLPGLMLQGLNSYLKATTTTAIEGEKTKRQAIAETVAALVSIRETEAKEGTTRQIAKMNHPIFWMIIVAALGPGVLNLWVLWIYNWLFWEHGVWPQAWSIAAYPPQAAAWVDMSIKWLFDPVGLSTTVATAAGAAWVTGSPRK